MTRRPSRIVSAVVGMFTSTPRPSTVVADALGAARETLAAREASLAAAQAAYDAALDQDRAAALVAKQVVGECELDRDMAARAITKLVAEAEQAREAESRAETDRAVAEADAAIETYREAAVTDWPLIVGAMRNIIGLRARAQTAEAAAKAAIATDPEPGRHAPRPGVDAFRVRPGRPREVLGEPRELELWTNGRGEVLGDEFQARMKEQPDGSGLLRSDHNSMRFDYKRRFRQVKYLPAEVSAAPDDLAASVRIPGLVAGDPAGWLPSDKDPSAILRFLDAFEAVAPAEDKPDTRQPRIDLEPIGGVIDVVARRLAEREAAKREAAERRAPDEAA
ncbi:hypothetical protein LRS73_18030 [Methylobacterium currus]|uniref:hypothetical protein n=1 Tax=Methylobacterium currus TaxID=2051553 RepID=UPI001E31C099|nr:hypothetical protein [Methylobacterium currus]UHC14447.1 hypothetical protein LRS73_18030 [Methylobacterium currus]